MHPQGNELRIQPDETRQPEMHLITQVDGHPVDLPLETIAFQKTLELAVPLSAFVGGQPANMEWVLVVEKDGAEHERWPKDSTITHPYPSEQAFATNWVL